MTKLVLAIVNLPVKILLITYVFILNLANRELSEKMKELVDEGLEDEPEQDLEIDIHN